MTVTYTEEAIADIVEATTYLNERNSTAAASLDAEIARCIERLAGRNTRAIDLTCALAPHPHSAQESSLLASGPRPRVEDGSRNDSRPGALE